MALIQVEIDPESVADAMNEDSGFMWHMWRVLAERTHMGLMADNASDIGGSLAPDQAEFVSEQLVALGEAVKSGFNMSNFVTI